MASASVSLNHTRIPLGSPVDVTYRFQVAPSAQFGKDYRVLVHFLDADEELMWTDDHTPPRPHERVESRADRRVHADRLRAALSLHRRSLCRRRDVRTWNQRARPPVG